MGGKLVVCLDVGANKKVATLLSPLFEVTSIEAESDLKQSIESIRPDLVLVSERHLDGAAAGLYRRWPETGFLVVRKQVGTHGAKLSAEHPNVDVLATPITEGELRLRVNHLRNYLALLARKDLTVDDVARVRGGGHMHAGEPSLLGTLMLTDGAISSEQLLRALDLQKRGDRRLLGTILLGMGHIDEPTLNRYLAVQRKLLEPIDSDDRAHLGELLLRGGKITQAQLDEAINVQRAGDQRRLGTILVGLGYVENKDLVKHLSELVPLPELEEKSGYTEKVLIYGQDEPHQQAVHTLVSDLGYQSRVLESSGLALEMLDAWRPEVTLIDVDDQKRGFALLERIRDDIYLANTAVVLMASNPTRELRLRAFTGGAIDLISKPVDSLELMFRMQNIVSVSRYRDKLERANDRLKREKSALSKFFSDDLTERILTDQAGDQLGGDNVNGTILFFDLRNSTGIAESLGPDTFSQAISLLFTDVMDIIYGNEGSINKMYGDGILATFGVPRKCEGDEIVNAARAAVEIRNVLRTFNQFRPAKLEEPIEAGIGIATGHFFAGNIGSVHRMEYTVLGDPVNTAARLESLCKEVDADILIDGTTAERLGNLAEKRKMDFSKLRGKISEIEIFALDDLHANDLAEQTSSSQAIA